MTIVATSYVFPAVQGKKGAVELSGHKILHNLVEGSNGDGIAGDYANLTRTITTPISVSGGVARSAFTIADTATGLKLDFSLEQQIVVGTGASSRLEQTYTIDNNGPDGVLVNFHAIWDINVLYGGSSADDDIVGVPPGLCYTYMRDPGSTVWGGAFIDGGSEIGVPTALVPFKPMAYYGAKEGVLPEGLQPPFSVSTSGSVPVWTGFKMPSTWFNQLADVGKNMPGETTTVAPGAIGHEYQFLLNAGGQAKIRLHRHYGLVALPCATVGVNCGNGNVDAGEDCDSDTDTDTCNKDMCTAPTCGDNYINMVAGETCESNGVDTLECNGAGNCQAAMCGDGYLNPAANEMCDDGADTATCNLQNCQPPVCGDGIINDAVEDCDSNELCTTECKWAFSLGGGCAGCSSNGTRGDGGGALLLAGVLAFTLRRRRRARRA
jgi:MYXO-CTERM domain-containing protein